MPAPGTGKLAREMPVPTPLHPRTSALCTSLAWKEWAGMHAVCRYDTVVDREYFALRHAATVMDATPLYKVEVEGPDAALLLSRVTVRDFRRTAIGRVAYVCWTDERGRVIDDGTVTRLGDQHYRLTSAEPSWGWFSRHAEGLDVRLTDVSRELVALALQGPRARDVLREVAGEAATELRYFRATTAQLAGHPGVVTRTGYTGDLGYELWAPAGAALGLWDAILEAGRPHGLLPMGLDALDVARVEAGYVLNGVEYFSARRAWAPHQMSTPYELGFDWMVQLDRPGLDDGGTEAFVGQRALRAEAERGPKRRLVCLEVDWDEFERLHERFDVPPHLPLGTCREGVPVYLGSRQIGQATSRSWSPALKKYLALATVAARHATPGTELAIEVTVEYHRNPCPARVLELPVLDLPRRKA